MVRISSAKVAGGKRLRAFIKAMPDHLRDEVTATIKSELDAVAKDARARLRPRRNWMGDAMREAAEVAASLKVRVSRRTLRGRVTARVPVEVRKGSGIRKNLARLIELGTNPAHFRRKPVGPHPIPPAPFLFPAWAKRRVGARAAFFRAMEGAVRKAMR